MAPDRFFVPLGRGRYLMVKGRPLRAAEISILLNAAGRNGEPEPLFWDLSTLRDGTTRVEGGPVRWKDCDGGAWQVPVDACEYEILPDTHAAVNRGMELLQ